MIKDKKIVILVLLCIILAGVDVVLMGARDTKAPEIEYGEAVPTYTAGSDYSGLLADVKAIDKKDDDVTDTLIVERIFPNADQQTATVLYVAKDTSNNVVKRERTVNYVPTQEATAFVPAVVPGSPVITLTQNTAAISIGTEFNPAAYVASISDDKDSPEELNEKLNIYGAESVDTSRQGIYHVIYSVADSDENSSQEALLTVEVH